ncbi:bifunctional riboflavin kinase/FAD synthetase [Candidatus Arthromitus sp. SFB-rat-Yit]|uniref:bifunctional riboflavin kinase/FAD synthetase n=1 Tax=Candidatus Arthromitus sp. SFB-rat-Yit TaxID=1041504 RepID=UPI000227A7E6|nr:bifunctional riboflavin kinase/FAD synthetase [Candidatus Arthromitus sp. SFB-rat-Yit]BAK81179.1 bifunctional riboflavin kinase/FMN adenylyltransferase [Candidatus Arthromitus sp. SFB-rat-Yit]
MKIIDSVNEKINDSTVLCIGNFDGVHSVHQKIINKVIQDAKKNYCKSMVITFRQHPMSFLNPNNVPRILTPLNEKIRIFKEMGVDYLGLYDFLEVKNIPPKQFVKYLVNNYGMKKIVCGFNFRFGYNNVGNIQYLSELSKEFGFDVDIIELLNLYNKKISSTKIRSYIKYGDIEKANDFLGRFFSITGEVIRGKQLGRKLGFPTANLKYDAKFCIPQNGVYSTITEFNGCKYASMTNIGYNPTFRNKYISIETFILDFEGDLYNQKIKVNFIKKLRNETLFSDVHALIDQLEKDKIDTINIIKKYLK